MINQIKLRTSSEKRAVENKNYQDIDQLQQAQMLKLVTKSFYKELVNYGVVNKDVITITCYLLDHVMGRNGELDTGSKYRLDGFEVNNIVDRWQVCKKLIFRDVYIAPLQREMISEVSSWLQNPIIKYSFVSGFPTQQSSLIEYFAAPDRQFFGIFSQGQYVGIIGADSMEQGARKLEMRKFIGDINLHGRGIGKCATFLFLYYCFMILDFNKVYIYSGDTNINNINLNSQFGFELEGILFEDIIIDDKKRDVVRMGLLKSRWKEIFLDEHPGG